MEFKDLCMVIHMSEPTFGSVSTAFINHIDFNLNVNDATKNSLKYHSAPLRAMIAIYSKV